MSKYDDFGHFMQTVLNEAEVLCKKVHGKSLASLYDVKECVVEIVKVVLSKGWIIFLALCVILAVGKITFITTLLAFCATPIGIAVVAALATFGGVAAIRTLYKNRVLPLAVSTVGKKYKADFDAHINQKEYIHKLIVLASIELVNTCNKGRRILEHDVVNKCDEMLDRYYSLK